jgi:hypothetical protein
MNSDALERLVYEVNSQGLEIFSTKTLNRLKNEDPLFAQLVDLLANKFAKELGHAGSEHARQLGAIYHRACELAEKYKESTLQYQTMVDNPDPSSKAINEAAALLNAVMARPRKDST